MYADDFAISRNRWSGETRPCAYSLALGDVAFADFDVDSGGSLILVRISFDGYGCCTPTAADVVPMPAGDSRELIDSIASDESLDSDRIRSTLRSYFEAHRDVLWEDALVEWGLVSVDR